MSMASFFGRSGRIFWRRGLSLSAPVALPTVAAFTMWYSSSDKTSRPPLPPSNWTLSCGVVGLSKNATNPSAVLKKPTTPDSCGEDSYAIAENDVQCVVGVADGVGGWRSKGIDPSGFSRSLMRHLEATVMGEAEDAKQATFGTHSSEPAAPIGAATLMKRAFWRMINAYHAGREQHFGSSTACVISLDKSSGLLDTANLGDSGFLLLRGPHVLLRSPIQQHRFNAPYQLTLAPDGHVSDVTGAAALQSMEVQTGDIIVVATDGLWDNLFEEQVLDILHRVADEDGWNAQGMARELVQEARRQSERDDYESPFCVEGRRHGYNRLGGKLDDITVIVAAVQYVQNKP